MRTVLKINNTDITPYISEDGISVSKDVRWSKEVTTRDGITHKIERKKLRIDITIVDNLYDSFMRDFESVFTADIVNVKFSDLENQQQIDADFYISENGHTVKKSFDDLTVVKGLGFSLEEVGWSNAQTVG